MRLCSVSGGLELLSAILPRTSCPPVPFPASSLASPLTHPGGSSTTPPRIRVLSSQDVTFDESVSYYQPLPPQGPAPLGVSHVDSVEPVEVAVDSGAARGAKPAGAGTGGVGPGVAEPERVEPGGAESGSAEPGGAEPKRAESGGPPGVPSRREPLSPQQLREWCTLLFRRAAGAGAAGGTSGVAGGASGAGAARGAAVVGAAGGAAGAGAAGGAAGARAAGGAAGAGAAGGAAGAGAAGGTGAVGAA
ncbi:unnamed protein product [Closterium sp. NIES-54]